MTVGSGDSYSFKTQAKKKYGKNVKCSVTYKVGLVYKIRNVSDVATVRGIPPVPSLSFPAQSSTLTTRMLRSVLERREIE